MTTAQSSRAVQRRDLGRFLRFMQAEERSDDRSLWTSRLSRAFLDALHKELDADGSRRFSDRTIARIAAHLKTFAKWIDTLRPFRLGDPTEKLKTVLTGPGLEVDASVPDFHLAAGHVIGSRRVVEDDGAGGMASRALFSARRQSLGRECLRVARRMSLAIRSDDSLGGTGICPR